MSLRIALPRGRWLAALVDLLGRAAYPVEPLRRDWDGGWVELSDGTSFAAIEAFDIPACVERGAVEAGVCGRNVLLEQDRELHELLELGVSEERLVLAAPAGLDLARGERLGGLRVATRYPRVARRHFARGGRQARVVAVAGSAGDALAAGLANAVVVAAPGDGPPPGLVEVDEVASCRLRLVSGRAAHTLSAGELAELVARLRPLTEAVAGEGE